MKFAKELERDLVPEWRIKYLDYKAGKKHVKAVARATHRINATPRTPARPTLPAQNHSTYGATNTFPRSKQTPSTGRFDGHNGGLTESLRESPAPLGADSRPDSEHSTSDEAPTRPPKKTPPVNVPQSKGTPDISDTTHYGSFVPTPPLTNKSFHFQLPAPALSSSSSIAEQEHTISPNTNEQLHAHNRPHHKRSGSGKSASIALPSSAYEVGKTNSPNKNGTIQSFRNRFPQEPRAPLLRRMFSNGTALTHVESRRLDTDLVALDQVRQKQQDFFIWMDKELEKIETFYKSKEDEAGVRLDVLREQLHEMRNRRIEELAAVQRDKAIRKEEERKLVDFRPTHHKNDENIRPGSRDHLNAWFDPIERVIGQAKAKVAGPRFGGNSKALQNMQVSPEMRANQQTERNRVMDEGRDYVRRPHFADEVPYRTAKRKLKLALQEFYRGMELLKSYALLNRTAFRKINKKYDKAVDAHPPLRYMNEKVNKAWFVNSDILDSRMHTVEDLYARYFERGNHKIATGKLRSSSGRPADQSTSAFRNGLLIGIGLVFAIQGVIYGSSLLHHHDSAVQLQTSYLLQIYGGYFLALYLFSWFCLDCSIWTRNKINYQFVFEYDPRHTMDWRELAEFPSFFLLLLGLFLWINFSGYGVSVMHIYYPVILVFVTILIILLPAPVLFHKSRKWFAYSHWRLLLAGLYPVEFRDFFLGDMYCSLTYLMSNIELFFCLYAHFWNNPTQCNSTHSRLLGFFSALPGIWRALQCIRRYYDTRNVFPHLVNCGKYFATIAYYMTLSIYRINQTHTNLAIFITFASINSIYTSIWDIFMDWSLLQPNASKRFLRDIRGYKNHYWYYGAMILDPILRCNWIFYAIYTQDLQHSTIVSFLVAFSEITRRGIWVIFRVENEHCSNVARFKASRDIPLPYSIHTESEEDFIRTHSDERPESSQTTGASLPLPGRSRAGTGATLEAQESAGAASLRRRKAPQSALTRILADAHTQDFEKKRKPENPTSASLKSGAGQGEGSSDDDDDDDDDDDGEGDDSRDEQEILDVESLLRERRAAKKRDD